MSVPSFDEILAKYDYELPPERIAQAPATPRDSACLLVYNRAAKETSWATVKDIASFLPKNAVLVLNETKVIPARLALKRSTGGTVRILVLGVHGETIRALSPKKLQAGDILTAEGGNEFEVLGVHEKEWSLKPLFPIAQLTELLERSGSMPLPPYIGASPLSEAELRERYQSVFAREPGSIAAPTASLHFTPELMAALEEAGITFVRVTLHVHLGTFSPLTEEQWNTGTLHTESYSIAPESVQALEEAKKSGRHIIPVGTTALRTLESAFDENGVCIKPSGETSIFIREGYAFKMADALLTNFHVPRSSLLMLVCAFAGRDEVMGLYKQAIEKEFRFYSFGDAMLVV